MTRVIVANLHQKDGKSDIPNWVKNIMDGTAAKNRKKKQFCDLKLNQNANGYVNDEHDTSDFILCNNDGVMCKMRDKLEDNGDTGGEGVTNLTWMDIAATINNTMLVVCLCITLLSILATIISFHL